MVLEGFSSNTQHKIKMERTSLSRIHHLVEKCISSTGKNPIFAPAHTNKQLVTTGHSRLHQIDQTTCVIDHTTVNIDTYLGVLF
jgi:hypothetical protein